MYAFTLERPTTVQDAAKLAAGGSKPLAGGQTLLASMKLRLSNPDKLADLSGIKDLSGSLLPECGVGLGGDHPHHRSKNRSQRLFPGHVHDGAE